jgi:transcription elongation GreA/GreB family factor
LARALLKRAVDDEVVVATPRGRLRYTVLAIGYGEGLPRDEEE